MSSVKQMQSTSHRLPRAVGPDNLRCCLCAQIDACDTSRVRFVAQRRRSAPEVATSGLLWICQAKQGQEVLEVQPAAAVELL